MAQATGTMMVADLRSNRFQSAAEFGLDTINEVLQRDLAVHNAIVADLFGDMCLTTSDRQRISGTSGNTTMIEMDENTRPPTQKRVTGATVGFPLRLRGYSVGWTRKWFQQNSVADMAEQIIAAKDAHVAMLLRDAKRSFYGVANYTFTDRLVSPIIDLAVKRFANADGMGIPNGPNGEVFAGSTHQHYTAAASLVVADLLASISTVQEHGFGNPITAINVANQAAVAALTGFTALVDSRFTINTAANQPIARLDVGPANNKPIGYLGASTIWVKPWAIAGYAVTYDPTTPMKPLVLRTRSGGGPDLAVAADIDAYPLHAQFMEAEYGFGVWNRLNGAIHQFTNATYQVPTIS